MKKAMVVPFSYFTNEQSEGREVEVTVLLASTLPFSTSKIKGNNYKRVETFRQVTLLAAMKHSVALPTVVAQEPWL